ncbi:hypothetical protein CMUS01_10910 [Colletotrichum musicola]|uniref:Uncharacterized protein n=1 Tax=Colletotrichum musicola TaxID=2175873 RepID=A0A8H6N825_9PEZI|nr:hypothetical protein CMUS01_10910 [Colletotrichum musicola]
MLVKYLLSVAVLGLSLPMGVLSNPVANSEARALSEDTQGAELQARAKEPGSCTYNTDDCNGRGICVGVSGRRLCCRILNRCLGEGHSCEINALGVIATCS